MNRATLYETAADDRASDDDRNWFAARPKRKLRLRLRLTGEIPHDVDTARCVLVAQLAPGLRLRETGDLRSASMAQLSELIAWSDGLSTDSALRLRLGMGRG